MEYLVMKEEKRASQQAIMTPSHNMVNTGGTEKDAGMTPHEEGERVESIKISDDVAKPDKVVKPKDLPKRWEAHVSSLRPKTRDKIDGC